MLTGGVSARRQGAGLADTPAQQYSWTPHICTWARPPALQPGGDTPTTRGNYIVKGSINCQYTGPKIQTNSKQEGGISIQLFYCEYAYCLLYVHGKFVGTHVCVARVLLVCIA